jgi:hypothetical protein
LQKEFLKNRKAFVAPLHRLEYAVKTGAAQQVRATHFDYESALQGYIAAYPHELEDGLLPYPDIKIREKNLRIRREATCP